MSRGKHGRRSENRAAVMTDTVAPYQRKVAALTAEVRSLKAKAAEQSRLAAAEVKRLRAERDEGIGPALAVAQQEARSLREERDAAQQRAAHSAKVQDRNGRAMIAHFRDEHGLTNAQAIETVLQWLVSTPDPDDPAGAEKAVAARERWGRDAPVVVDGVHGATMHRSPVAEDRDAADKAERIMRARGVRR